MAFAAGAAAAGAPELSGRAALPAALTHDLQPLSSVPRFTAPTVNAAALREEDVLREQDGLPPRFAVANPVSLTPSGDGVWEPLDAAQQVWRLRVTSPGALSLNLGFTRFRLPKGGRLCVYPTADPTAAIVFSPRDNEEHGQLWTPIVPGDDLIVELTLPAAAAPAAADALELGAVNVGYRGFIDTAFEKSGLCNIDVVCPEGDLWRDEIQSVAVYQIGGVWKCTGFMINNTAQDARPLFLTANHCAVTVDNAASLVAYWNFQSPVCGQQGGGSLTQFQTGAVFRATLLASDFTLVELDDAPNPSWNVTFAGWDRSAADPASGVTIHHPSADEKSISFDYDPLETSTFLGTVSPGDGTHLRVVDWDLGTTEPGSSGSPLFNPEHRVVGQLHGGYAACDNSESDYYGRLSVSWEGGGTSATRLRDWLDPLDTGAVTLDLIAPDASGIEVTPSTALDAEGPVGGPFTPASLDYTVENVGGASLAYAVESTANWLTVTNAAGTLPAGGTAVVTVSIAAAVAAALPTGIYADTLRFVNNTNHAGDAARLVTLRVGDPDLVRSWPLDVDPGWTAEGQWAFGPPEGGGGEYGQPDPTAGHTGANVLGYNLAGDYPALMSEQHLTSETIDCSGLSSVELRFWRWLGVEHPAFDRASVGVSVDGDTWTTVWMNGGTIADSDWVPMTLDLTELAAGEPAVFLRWTMGPTDESWQYCGWNIDDIEIWGYPAHPDTNEVPLRTALVGAAPNPFSADTEIAFDLARDGRARLRVYDLRGRLVRGLLDEPRLAGRNTASWDGRDDDGRQVPSGVYLLRLAAAGVKDERKIARVR